MKKQYIAALACLVAGAIGLAGAYSTNSSKEQAEEEPILESSSIQKYQSADEIKENAVNNADVDEAASMVGREADNAINQAADSTKTAENAPDKSGDSQGDEQDDGQAEKETAETSVEVEPEAQMDGLSFNEASVIKWPVEGEVLLPFSADKTIYMPTLQQYQYNYGLAISANVNDKVYCGAKGCITDIVTNEETGCTVTVDIGNGYSAIYGQLKELNFDKGDTVENGQVIGYVSEPTKYYAVEGSNVYFAMTKDGQYIDPAAYMAVE